ncbi:Uncharacterised protein [Candidatus Burarchaeum australiense]|nr:Uncharacterised protein [Candidatus Burarchaeum australiense]
MKLMTARNLPTLLNTINDNGWTMATNSFMHKLLNSGGPSPLLQSLDKKNKFVVGTFLFCGVPEIMEGESVLTYHARYSSSISYLVLPPGIARAWSLLKKPTTGAVTVDCGWLKTNPGGATLYEPVIDLEEITPSKYQYCIPEDRCFTFFKDWPGENGTYRADDNPHYVPHGEDHLDISNGTLQSPKKSLLYLQRKDPSYHNVSSSFSGPFTRGVYTKFGSADHCIYVRDWFDGPEIRAFVIEGKVPAEFPK